MELTFAIISVQVDPGLGQEPVDVRWYKFELDFLTYSCVRCGVTVLYVVRMNRDFAHWWSCRYSHVDTLAASHPRHSYDVIKSHFEILISFQRLQMNTLILRVG